MEKLEEVLASAALKTEHSHIQTMRHTLAHSGTLFAGVDLKKPRIPVVSNVDAKLQPRLLLGVRLRTRKAGCC